MKPDNKNIIPNISLETIVSLCKRRGFVFPGSEIYGGLAGTFDYGPYGLALKKNIENLWWKMFVDTRDDMFGIDAAILMNPTAWKSSGHIDGFTDLMTQSIECGTRFRVDKLVEEVSGKGLQELFKTFMSNWWWNLEPRIDKYIESLKKENLDLQKEKLELEKQLIENKIQALNIGINPQELIFNSKKEEAKLIDFDKFNEHSGVMVEFQKYIEVNGGGLENFAGYLVQLNKVQCPKCLSAKFTKPEPFNLMFKTQTGTLNNSSIPIYLRPETAGGIFVNFKNVVDSLHPKLPFGIAQIGKAFRNEIAPREFLFRVRELEQMEIEYFVRPEDWERAFEEWRESMQAFARELGLPETMLHELEVASEDLAHYSKRTIDFEFDYPFGRKELWGLAYRTDFDLNAHQTGSSQSLEYVDEVAGGKLIPHVIEPSLGVGRTLLAVLIAAYREDSLGGESRTYLALQPKLAPVKAMVSPLLKNKPELVEKAKEVRKELQKIHPAIAWDDNGNIGKRYRRQDEIGTPFCITIDFDTLGETASLKDTVTLRHRDTGEQERLTIAEVGERIRESLT